ncbi:MAG: histidine kinase [Pedobacter sp.]|nr:histidine kinase [Pedobacter sp.]
MTNLRSLLQQNYRTLFAVSFLALVFYFSKQQGYILFHTFVELFSIVVAFAVFIVTWNSRQMQDNVFLHLVGISYIFIGALDLLHTLTYRGMNMIPVDGFPANQFWVATRMMEALTILTGLLLIKRNKKLNSDLVFLGYFLVSLLIIFSILVWRIFPVCFIGGLGQTDFKVYMEYAIIAVLLVAGVLLVKNRKQFSASVYKLLLASVIFTIFSESCFASYETNTSTINELGHYAKLVAFFLIYKANVETGFIRPTDLIFKNLKENEEKYRTLAENLPGLVFRFNGDLKCIYANNEEAKASRIIEMLGPMLLMVMQIGVVQEDSFEVDKGVYAVQVIPEYGSGSYLVICSDVTGLKQTQRQLQALNDTKDKLFSIIAHDLKNPFTSLLTFSELIYKKADSLERVKIGHIASRMNESARQAYTLLENLLNWSRIQTGLLKPEVERIPVEWLFAETQNYMRTVAQAKGIELSFGAAGLWSVLADRQMCLTVLRNLVSNAVKFSFHGGEVKVTVESKNGQVLFSIWDSGTGIPVENQKLLLEVGNKFSATGTESESGTGLGLVLCREFVEVNGGSIFFESEFGVETTFYFTLPLS